MQEKLLPLDKISIPFQCIGCVSIEECYEKNSFRFDEICGSFEEIPCCNDCERVCERTYNEGYF
jgi:hypothetical protein